MNASRSIKFPTNPSETGEPASTASDQRATDQDGPESIPMLTGDRENPVPQEFVTLLHAIGVGVDSLPDDLTAAVSQLPAPGELPPSKHTWAFFLVAWFEAMRTVARRVLQEILPRTVPSPDGQRVVIPSDDDQWICQFDLEEEEAENAILRHPRTDVVFREYANVRADGRECFILEAAPANDEPLQPEEIFKWYASEPRTCVGQRLRQQVPTASQLGHVFSDLIVLDYELAFCGMSGSHVGVGEVSNVNDEAILQLFERMEDPHWQPWLACLCGDWLWAAELLQQVGDTALLAEVQSRADKCM